jgi:hypothetical protein
MKSRTVGRIAGNRAALRLSCGRGCQLRAGDCTAWLGVVGFELRCAERKFISLKCHVSSDSEPPTFEWSGQSVTAHFVHTRTVPERHPSPYLPLEPVGDKCPKQGKDRKHQVGSCTDSPLCRESRRIEFSGTTPGSSRVGNMRCHVSIRNSATVLAASTARFAI